MRKCKNHIGIILLLAWHSSYAQLKNDSVFTQRALSSIRLLDIGQRRPAWVRADANAARPVLFVFLSPECPLCQNYTSVLNKLDREYAGKIRVYGIIPGRSYLPAEISAFARKYKIAYPLLMDSSLSFCHYLQASTTPEAILLSPGNELLYKGAIDNWYKALGRNRLKATEFYLQNAIDRYLKQEPSSLKRTIPVGCLINDR